MGSETRRVVRDTMIGLDMPDVAVWSERVTVVLGQNPGFFTGPGTNTFLVGTGPRPLLLDTGQGLDEYLPLLDRALRSRGDAEGPGQIVLTHDHPDHIGGVESVQGHFEAVAVYKMPHPRRSARVPCQDLADGDVVRTAGATLRAVVTPGHAADHLCFYLVEERALFTGDLVLGAGTTVIPDDGDLSAYLESLRRIRALSPAVIYPAHGPAIVDPRRKIDDYLAHRALRERQILSCLSSDPTSVADIVRVIYTDVPEFLHPAAAMSVRAHLRKLEHDGRVVREGEQWRLG